MASGGSRQGSGRIPLGECCDCIWIVQRVRSLGNSPEIVKARKAHFFKRQAPNLIDNQTDLQNNYDKLDRANISQRRAMIENDFNTPLEETRQIRASSGFPVYLQLPPPNQFQKNQIYK